MRRVCSRLPPFVLFVVGLASGLATVVVAEVH